jgi:hypothetical protein
MMGKLHRKKLNKSKKKQYEKPSIKKVELNGKLFEVETSCPTGVASCVGY